MSDPAGSQMSEEPVPWYHCGTQFGGRTFKPVTTAASLYVQAFLDFHGFRITAVYNSILISSPLVLLSNLDLRGFCFRFFMCPYINRVNPGMPVLYYIQCNMLSL